MPDQDEFVRSTKKAQAAFLVTENPDGAPERQTVRVDLTALAAWIGKLFTVCNGLPSLAAVLMAARRLGDEPLFARDPAVVELVLDQIDVAAVTYGRTDLDLILRRAATREVLDGRYQASSIVERFFGDMITRYAIEAKRGLADRITGETLSRERARIEIDMLPVVRDAAALVARNPGLQRLALAARHRAEGDVSDMDISTGEFFHVASA